MKKIILILILALFSANSLVASKDNFYSEALAKISKAERRDVRPYLNAAWHVSKMWHGKFPDPDFNQKVAVLMGFMGKETDFEPNTLNFNIPGIYLRGLHGRKVRRFSVDYGVAGLNEINIENTYTVAKAIQSGRNITSKELKRMGLSPNLMVELKKRLTIPQSMSLFKIDIATAIEARRQYDLQKKSHIRPKKIKIDIPYLEDTQDKVDSVLLYRTIEELDRRLRGWPSQAYDSEAYYICQSILKK